MSLSSQCKMKKMGKPSWEQKGLFFGMNISSSLAIRNLIMRHEHLYYGWASASTVPSTHLDSVSITSSFFITHYLSIYLSIYHLSISNVTCFSHASSPFWHGGGLEEIMSFHSLKLYIIRFQTGGFSKVCRFFDFRLRY